MCSECQMYCLTQTEQQRDKYKRVLEAILEQHKMLKEWAWSHPEVPNLTEAAYAGVLRRVEAVLKNS